MKKKTATRKRRSSASPPLRRTPVMSHAVSRNGCRHWLWHFVGLRTLNSRIQ